MENSSSAVSDKQHLLSALCDPNKHAAHIRIAKRQNNSDLRDVEEEEVENLAAGSISTMFKVTKKKACTSLTLFTKYSIYTILINCASNKPTSGMNKMMSYCTKA